MFHFPKEVRKLVEQVLLQKEIIAHRLEEILMPKEFKLNHLGWEVIQKEFTQKQIIIVPMPRAEAGLRALTHLTLKELLVLL